MRRLRGYGIYKTPGPVRQVYAVPAGEGAYLLFDRKLGTAIPPRFEVLTDGSVRDWHGDMTRWTVEDLVDTGESFEG